MIDHVPHSQSCPPRMMASNLAHTYSIVACDTATGEMGVAVQSHWFSVGSVVPWAEAGVGAIATQALVNVSFGTRGLDLLKQGKTAPEVVETLTASDEGKDVRQVAIVDSLGNVAAHTGQICIPEAGHIVGKNFSVQANMMLTDGVWQAMARAFEASTEPLAERMVAALEAAQNAGGDIRGRQSAAILVVRTESTDISWEDRLIDLRVEDDAEPVRELRRLLTLFRAYEYMNEGDVAMEKVDRAGALKAYTAAQHLCPDNIEMRYWHAVSLVNMDMIEKSLPIFRKVFLAERNWLTLTDRLSGVGMLNASEEDLERIRSLVN